MTKLKVAVAQQQKLSKRVGGFRSGSSGAFLYEVLVDGKAHGEAELRKAMVRGGVDPKSFAGRMFRFKQEGKQSGRFALEHLEGGSWKMSVRKSSNSAAQAKPVKATTKKKVEKKSLTVAVEKKEVAKPSVSDDAE